MQAAEQKAAFSSTFEDARVLLTLGGCCTSFVHESNFQGVTVIYSEGIYFCASAAYRGLRFVMKKSPLNSFFIFISLGFDFFIVCQRSSRSFSLYTQHTILMAFD